MLRCMQEEKFLQKVKVHYKITKNQVLVVQQF